MKAWSAALASELRDWPQIALKPFFGFTALYRGKFLFGLLPRTRSIVKGNSVAFRFDNPNHAAHSLIAKDSRVAAFDKEKIRWFLFELACDSDLHDALDYLGRAFAAAPSSKKTQ